MLSVGSASVGQLFFRSAEEAAPKLAMHAVAAPVRTAAEIEAAMTTLGREGGRGIIVPVSSFMSTHRRLIIELAAR